MTLDRRLPAALLAALALTLGAAACGDDDDGGDEMDTSIPEVTIPDSATETESVEPTTTTEPTSPEEDNGRPGGNVNPDEPDTETNDKPPDPGSPEEAFEQDCAANPGKCG